MRMTVDIIKQEKISQKERTEMYSIFSKYYENASPVRFKKDLNAKDWVITLKGENGNIAGFSSLQVYERTVSSKTVLVLYSGDTIVDKAYRLNGYLAGGFGHVLLRAIEKNNEGPVYWLLTSKGVRTYRFLPVFFKTFFPVFNGEPPSEVKLITDQLAAEKFGSNYSPDTQVISHNGRFDRVCDSEHDPLLLGRDDPHIDFFIRKNPGYIKGDELACITPITRDNLNSRALRVIKHTKVNWDE